MKEEKLLEVRGLKKHFKTGRKQILKAVDDVSFDIRRGETLGLVGESGCGKSTLGRTIIGIYEPTEGRIDYHSENMQMIFQDPYACLNPRMTVSEIIAEGWDIRKLYKGLDRRARIVRLLEMVGLNKEHGGRFPHEFSGGQRQRIGIARALSMNPDCIICDEPISALDVSIQAQVMNLLIELQKELDLTYMFIAHDISMVKHISDRIAVMYLGRIVELADSGIIYSNPMHPYTELLFSAIPVPDPAMEKNREIAGLEGEMPSPYETVCGCRFESRCTKAKEICKLQAPELKKVEEGHHVACHLY